MNPRRVLALIIVAVLVIGILVAYSLQTLPAPSTTTITSTRTVLISGSNHTVTVSGAVTTTTVLGQIQLRSGVGSQPLLCSWASYFVPDTVTSTNASAPVQTYSAVSNYTTTIFTENAGGGPVTTTNLGVFASATNSTQSVGYVVTTTTYPNYGLSYGWIVTTCTYLP